MLRMGKDFGNDVLPLGRGYSHQALFPGDADFTWSDVFPMMEFLLREMTEHGGYPGWTYGMHGGVNANILYLPRSSQMSRKWAGMDTPGGPVEDVSAAANLTVSTFDEASATS